MGFFNRISLLHVELTERCNAACPMCGRTDKAGEPNPHLAGRELSFADFSGLFPEAFLRDLRQIRFCGNFGDPAAARDSLKICEHLRGRFPQIILRINTNGSLQTQDWWFSLGRLFRDSSSSVQFGIDGLGDTHHLYRRGTSFEKVLSNAQSFIRGGGNAQWVFLVFEHNEHQLEAARDLAAKLGFREFIIKRSKRFLGGEQLSLKWQQRREDPAPNGMKLGPPRERSLRNGALLQLEDEEKKGRNILQILSECEISCRAQRLEELYVSAEGLAFPCCWIGAAVYSAEHPEPSGPVAMLLERTGGKSPIDLKQVTINQALESDFFSAVAASWESGQPQSERLFVCARICGVGVETFEKQFEPVRLEQSSSSLHVL